MGTELRRLTIDFLEDKPEALRRITQANWQLECLISSRSELPRSLRREESRRTLDVPGVYLLIGPPEKSDDSTHNDWRLYVGQADSVADRLETHLKNIWWRTVVVIRRPDNHPLNLSQCKFMESKVHALASKAGTCVLENKNAPGLPFLSPTDEIDTQDILDKAVVIVGALGFNFFEAPVPVGAASRDSDKPRPVPPKLQPLLEEIRKLAKGPSCPKAEWYGINGPEYRMKVVNGGDFRVFGRVTWAKNWFRVWIRDAGHFKVTSAVDLEKLNEEIQKAYDNAEKYLQRNK